MELYIIPKPIGSDKLSVFFQSIVVQRVNHDHSLEVWKSTTFSAHLTAKAFNARVLVSWLASCLTLVVNRRVDEGQQAEAIYTSGMKYLRAHKLLVKIAHRQVCLSFAGQIVSVFSSWLLFVNKT